jgi:hypothetical protein
MRVETVKCDQCGAIKGEGNHWLYVDVENIAGTKHQRPVIIIDIDGDPQDNCERRDLCGQDCFHKHLDALLFTKPKPVD